MTIPLPSAQVLSSDTPIQSWLGCPTFLPYNSSKRTTVENSVSNSTSIVAWVSVAAGTCLPSRSLAAAVCSCLLKLWCLETDVVPLSVLRPLPSNGYFSGFTVLGLSKYATVLCFKGLRLCTCLGCCGCLTLWLWALSNLGINVMVWFYVLQVTEEKSDL
jgi:hypothetical protein